MQLRRIISSSAGSLRILSSPCPKQFRNFSSSDRLVTCKKVDGIAEITLNMPEKLNALTVEMGDQFCDTIDQLRDNCDDIHTAILTGAGKAFSAGGDMKFLHARNQDTASRNSQIMRNFYERFLYVRQLPMPVIAAINGPAIGAGLCLAMACDIRIAAANAKLGVTFTKLGLHPGMGATHFLPKLVGPQQAAKLLLSGDVISGTEAEKIGLVLEAIPQDQVLSRARELAQSFGQAAPIAVRSCVRSLRMGASEGLDRALWREADTQSYCYGSQDMSEGLAAIAEKRAPNFSQTEHYLDEK